MRKVIEIVLYSFLVFFISALIVGHVMNGGTRLGNTLSTFVKTIVNIPNTFRQMAENSLPAYIKTTDEPIINELKDDLFVLHTFQETNKAILMNLKDNSVVHEWNLQDKKPAPHFRYSALLLPNKELIYYMSHMNYLAKIDSNSNTVWEATGSIEYHHSAELDGEGGFWICGRNATDATDTLNFNSKASFAFKNESIVRIDIATGKVTHEEYLSDIFERNGLNPVLTHYAAEMEAGDIFHMNDIQPVLTTAGPLTKGDLLISLRHQSFVFHYSPSSGKILKIWKNRMHAQHDVDIINDSIISVFNNNVPIEVAHLLSTGKADGKPYITSEILLFNYEGDSLYSTANTAMGAHEIFSPTEGLIEYLPSGRVFIEEQNQFNIWVFEGEKLLYKGYFNHYAGKEYKEIPNWTKVYDNLNFN